MIKGSELTYRLNKLCIFCNKNFLAKVHNSKICNDCKEEQNKKIDCLCGCGKKVKNKGKKISLGCKFRGKTYKEIYGDKIPKCGFKKGLENANFTRNKFVGCKYKNSIGEKYRSSLEVIFSEFLIKNKIPYEYEKRFLMMNGRYKIIDFVLNDYIFVEVTGFAYKKWQDDFIDKMKILRNSTENPILILTYPKHLITRKIKECYIKYDTFFESIYNEENILKKINMFFFMNYTNKLILQHEKTIHNS